jgi:hypothetical protein
MVTRIADQLDRTVRLAIVVHIMGNAHKIGRFLMLAIILIIITTMESLNK